MTIKCLQCRKEIEDSVEGDIPQKDVHKIKLFCRKQCRTAYKKGIIDELHTLTDLQLQIVHDCLHVAKYGDALK